MYNVFVQTLAAFLNRCLDQCCIRVAVLESKKNMKIFKKLFYIKISQAIHCLSQVDNTGIFDSHHSLLSKREES